MWLDYGLFVSTALVLIAVLALIVMLIRNRAGRTQLLFVVLLLVGLVATPFLRPERFRERGDALVVTEGVGGPETEVELIGTCLSVFRQIGPLSFIMGNDLFPGADWSREPIDSCELMGVSGTINLPDVVRSGKWMLCDYATCHQLVSA